jgi:signal transduction histidine kinase
MTDVGQQYRSTPAALPDTPNFKAARDGVREDVQQEHLVHFYDLDVQLSEVVGRFVVDGLRAGEPTIVIATEPHRLAISQTLSSLGFDASLACESGRLTFLDARLTLQAFLRDGKPDAELFESTLGALMARTLARTGGTRVRTYGEMVDVLWRSGEKASALQVEEMWNRLQERYRFTLLCAYNMAGFYKQPADQQRVCSTHTHVHSGNPLERPTESNRTASPPQDARKLARELKQREQVESTLREMLHRTEQLYRFAQAVVASDRIEAVFEAAMASIESAVDTTRSAILLFDDAGKMRFRAWHGLSANYRAAVDGHSPWSADATDVAPVLIADALADPAMAPYADVFREERIGALGFIPLTAGGRLIGKVMVYFEGAHTFGSQEVETAGAVSNHLASVITRFKVVEELKENIRQNELFAGVLAHDLRNPLNAIITSAQLLLLRHEREQSLEDQDAASVGRILSSGRRMTALIQDLLDVSRARSGGGIATEPMDTDLAELCVRAVAELEAAHPDWPISLECRCESRGHWDANRLLQVLSNLIANAGQHGVAGRPIHVTIDGTDSDAVVVNVHNDGVIAADLLPDLFNPFRRAARPGRAHGLGLGLYIVREIVQSHGGEVSVQSSESAGTTVCVRLPRSGARRDDELTERRYVRARRIEG